ISAKASDAIGITHVEFLLDGAVIQNVIAKPWAFAFATTGVADGAHTLQARAYDAAGNVGQSPPVGVAILNHPVTTSLLFNGGFETGDLRRWTVAGPATAQSGTVRSGTFAAQIGSTTAFTGNASIE